MLILRLVHTIIYFESCIWYLFDIVFLSKHCLKQQHKGLYKIVSSHIKQYLA